MTANDEESFRSLEQYVLDHAADIMNSGAKTLKAYFSRGDKEKNPEKAKLYKYIKACKDNFTPEQSAKYQDWESSYCKDSGLTNLFNFVVAYFTEHKQELRLKGKSTLRELVAGKKLSRAQTH